MFFLFKDTVRAEIPRVLYNTLPIFSVLRHAEMRNIETMFYLCFDGWPFLYLLLADIGRLCLLICHTNGAAACGINIFSTVFHLRSSEAQIIDYFDQLRFVNV